MLNTMNNTNGTEDKGRDKSLLSFYYSSYPCIPAPDWMNNWEKGLKFLKEAELKDDEFEFAFGGLLKKKQRCRFHILYYTKWEISSRRYSFAAMDRISGSIYFIECTVDGSEGSGFYIEKSKLVSAEEFLELTKKNERFLPGVTNVFKDLTDENKKDYLSVTYNQIKAERCFMVMNEKEDVTEFLFFMRGYNLLYLECAAEKYKQWKSERPDILDNVHYSSEIFKMADIRKDIKVGVVSGRKNAAAVNKIMSAAEKGEYTDGTMSIIYVVNGIVYRLRQNVYNEVIDAEMNEIKMLNAE